MTPPDGVGSRPLLAARGLTVESGGTKVLRDVSFELPHESILGLIGESGAGKSMIGRVIAHQLPPGFAATGGTLDFAGTDLLTLPPREHRALLGRRIVFIPQEPMGALNPSWTIGRHFVEHLARLKVPSGERRGMAIEALADMRLPAPETVYAKYPFQLSGGMCQRVLIALAFISKPDLVIADEPTASLDVTTQAHIVGLLRRLQSKYRTGVVFITHQLRLAAHICDNVAVLYAGEIVEYGPGSTVFRRPQHPYTRALDIAIPRFTGPWRPLSSPPGHMPGLNEFRALTGCRFAARCASVIDSCRAGPPPLRPQPGDVLVRCIREAAAPAAEPEPVPAPHGAPAADATPLLSVEALGRTFRGSGLFRRSAETRAVHDVTFTIAPGEFIGVVGESGSGKSTLGRLIMGLDRPSTGRIVLDGQPLGHDPAEWQRRIGSIQLVFQDPRSALNPRRNVLSLVTQPLQATSHGAQSLRDRAKELAIDTGLPPDVLSRMPRQMSGGQRQRVNIARALCAMPRLLIADEITSGLDVSVQAQILNLLLRLRRQYNITLVMISHDLAVVRYLCSRVIVMRRGEVVEHGVTEQVFAAPQHPYTRELLDALPPEDLDHRWSALDLAG